MISVAEIIKQIVLNDEVAYEALRRGLLNKNAFARDAHKKVEALSMKEVNVGTISTALRRMEKEFKHMPRLKPKFQLTNISVKSPLSDITYPLRNFDFDKLATLYQEVSSSQEFLITTQGANEITLICGQSLVKKCETLFGKKPLFKIENLGAVSCQFSEEYFKEPNLIFAMISEIAKKNIDLIEIVSTYTEITFVVKESEILTTFEQMRKVGH